MCGLLCFLLSSVGVFAEAPAGYYESVYSPFGELLQSADFRQALHDVIDDHHVLRYTDTVDETHDQDTLDVWDALVELDSDPHRRGFVIVIYRLESYPVLRRFVGPRFPGDGWAREHTWPSSHGFPNNLPAGDASYDVPYTDLHALRAVDQTVNQSRGSKDYDVTDLNDARGYPEAPLTSYDRNSWEPPDPVKGDLARGLFYMAIRYEGDKDDEPDLRLVENADATRSRSDGIGELGVLSALLNWHREDPPDPRERERNDYIYLHWQGNRNPFIDHPEWVELIDWEDG